MDWETFKKEAEAVAREEGFPVAVLLGQAALETGRSIENAPGFNFFGIKGRGNAGTQLLNTKEQGAGGLYDTSDYFAKFATPKDAIRAYLKTVENLVPDWKTYAHDPVQLVAKLKQAGYATDSSYIQKVISTPEFKAYASEKPGKALPPNDVPIGQIAKYNKETNKWDMYNTSTGKLLSPTPQPKQQKKDKGFLNGLFDLFNNVVPKAGASGMLDYNPPSGSPMGTQALGANTGLTSGGLPFTNDIFRPAPIKNTNSYTTRPGDTLWGIAERNLGSGSLYKQLTGYSGDPRQLPVGQKIGIPGKSQPSSQPAISPQVVNKTIQGTQPGLTTLNPQPSLVYKQQNQTEIQKKVKPTFSLYPTAQSSAMLR